MFKSTIFCTMETNRQKKIGGVDQGWYPTRWSEKKQVSNLIISVSKVVVTSDLSVATVHLSVFPQDKAKKKF
jgi:ribosome-binding factor A